MADTTKLSRKAIALLMKFEVGGGQSYYDKFLARPSWPGYSSGITVGIGVDLGYDDSILDHLATILEPEQLERLKDTVGAKGNAAKPYVKGLRDIVIPWDFAARYFEEYTLPKYIEQTLNAFPGAENLPDDAFGALVSLVFNRGPLVNNTDRRKEMANIRTILAKNKDNITAPVVRAIGDEVRKMSRLWPNNKASNNDLYDRRQQEADLIINSVV